MTHIPQHLSRMPEQMVNTASTTRARKEPDDSSEKVRGWVKGAMYLRDRIYDIVVTRGGPVALGGALKGFLDARIKTGYVEPTRLLQDLKAEGDRCVKEHLARRKHIATWEAAVKARMQRDERTRYAAPILGDAPQVDSMMRPVEPAPAVPVESDETFRLPIITTGEETWRLERE